MPLVYKTAYQSADDPLEYVLSDDSVDRYGDIIQADGWMLANFRKNPIALFGHKSDAPIGTWSNIRVEGNRLIAKLKLAAAGTSHWVDMVRQLIEQRVLRACSVGFRDIQSEPLDPEKPWGALRFLKSELVECSIVAVPANPNALQVSKSLGLSDADMALVFSKPATEDHRRSVPVPGKPAPQKAPRGKIPMKLAQRIQAAQAELNRLRDHLTALSDNDEPTDDDIALQEQLPDEIENAKKELERLQRMEKALVVQTVDESQGNGDETQQRQAGRQEIIVPERPFRVPAKKLTPLDFFVRAAAVFALQKIKQQPLEVVRRQMYGDDESTAMVLRAVVSPGSTTVPGWAQELVATATVGFLDSLHPNTIFPAIRSRGGSFTFGPGQGNIRVPGRSATPTLAGAWVGEGQPIPVRRIGFTSALLTPKKLAVISTFTHELADYSTPNIEAVIRDAMRVDTALVIDTYLLDDLPATSIRPPGLRNGVAGLTPSADANKTVAMIADIKSLVAAIIAVNGGRDIVIVMNTLQEMGINFAQTPNGFLFPSEGEAGRRFNVTFASSTAVTPGMVVAVDASEFASASGDAPEFNVSDQATIHEEDTAPVAIGTTGTPGVVAAPARSLWQTDTIGIRMRMPLNWAMRRPGMVSWMTGVTW
jgi:HK97 family phage prohead protease